MNSKQSNIFSANTSDYNVKQRNRILTYSNLVSQAVQYAQCNELTGSLKEVVQHMLEHTNWFPSFHMVTHGVPPFYEEDFEYRMGKCATPPHRPSQCHALGRRHPIAKHAARKWLQT